MALADGAVGAGKELDLAKYANVPAVLVVNLASA